VEHSPRRAAGETGRRSIGQNGLSQTTRSDPMDEMTTYTTGETVD
jgi:hypothetical protein